MNKENFTRAKEKDEKSVQNRIFLDYSNTVLQFILIMILACAGLYFGGIEDSESLRNIKFVGLLSGVFATAYLLHGIYLSNKLKNPK